MKKVSGEHVAIGLLISLAIAGNLAIFTPQLLSAIYSVALGRSTPYREAVRRANASPKVIAALGQPITASVPRDGQFGLRLPESWRSIEIEFQLKGPRKEALVELKAAKKRSGGWRYHTMKVVPEGEAPIDLLGPHAFAPSRDVRLIPPPARSGGTPTS